MYWVADILLILYLALFIYRGIKRMGTLNAIFWFTKTLLLIVLTLGSAFAVAFFIFPLLGLTQDMQVGLLDFGHSFAGILKLFNIKSITHEDIAFYTAVAISMIVLMVPMYFFFKWIFHLCYRYRMWLREQSKLVNIVGGVINTVVNFAIGAGILLVFYWGFAALDGSGLFTYTNDVLRAGYLTGLVYEYNPLYDLLGKPGCLAKEIGDLIKGNF